MQTIAPGFSKLYYSHNDMVNHANQINNKKLITLLDIYTQHGLSQEQIANLLDLSTPTVHRLIHLGDRISFVYKLACTELNRALLAGEIEIVRKAG